MEHSQDLPNTVINTPIEITESMHDQELLFTHDLGEELEPFALDSRLGKWERIKGWTSRNKLKLAIGAAAISTAVTLNSNSLDELQHDVVNAAPWVGAGILASEAAFCVGAAMMVTSIGDKIGNPFKLKSRIPEIADRANNSKLFKSGFWINAGGAVGDFAVLSAGVMKEMPVESYPILSLTLLDLGATIALRKVILSGIRKNSSNELPMIEGKSDDEVSTSNAVSIIEKDCNHRCIVRDATEDDIDQLVIVDRMMFDKAYGTNIPPEEDTKDMLTRRLRNIRNGGGRMIVSEKDGKINGFATYFRTNKPWEEFKTWEDTTSDGTLDEVVNSEGKYGYVVNMTVTPDGSEDRAMQKIMAKLFSYAVIEDIEYGYFVSRIPQFTEWLSSKGLDYTAMEESMLDDYAKQYIGTNSVSSRGKLESVDYELRTYDRAGFNRGVLVKGGFSDEESLNYGVTYKVDVPLSGKPKPVRFILSQVLTLVSKSKKVASKLF